MRKEAYDVLVYPVVTEKSVEQMEYENVYTFVVNDLFFPWQRHRHQGERYRKDRGYMFEKALHENTDSLLYRSIGSYRQAEQQAQVPMLLFTPTILNDERRLFVGAQGFSYLGQPWSVGPGRQPEPDGVDIHHLLPPRVLMWKCF